MSPYNYFLVALLFVSSDAWSFDYMSLLGDQSTHKKVYAGYLVFHNDFDKEHSDELDYYFKAGLSAAYKGVALSWFKNTYNQDTYFIGIERIWYEKYFSNNLLSFNYKLGPVYGYCIKDKDYKGLFSFSYLLRSTSCNESSREVIRILPVISAEYFMHDVGLSLGFSVSVTTLNLSYKF